MTIRTHPITLEQAIIDCPECGELLAIIDAIGFQVESTYLWKPNDQEPATSCHGNGLSNYDATRMYHRNEATMHATAIVDTYNWSPRKTWQPIDDEPDLGPPPPDQLELETT